jgi:hypothetical protein
MTEQSLGLEMEKRLGQAMDQRVEWRLAPEIGQQKVPAMERS